jgi:hypothetical protein
MLFHRGTSSPAQTALFYITLGTLTIVWTGVWFIYLLNHPPESPGIYYWIGGLGLTGLTLVIIGLTVGHIGRAAKPAEASPPVATPPATEHAAAVPTPVVMPTALPAQPAVPATTVAPVVPAARNNGAASVPQHSR